MPQSSQEHRLVTFRLSVPRFQQLLEILLAPEAPDELANRVLMACTRPHDGIISVPLSLDEATAIADLVSRAGSPYDDLADLLREQVNPTQNT